MECNELVSNVLSHLGERFACMYDGVRCRIVTPFRRPGGDLIDIYVRPQEDGSFVVSDLGESLGFLVSMGYDPREGTNSAHALKHLQYRYGVEIPPSEGVIRKHVAASDLSATILNVIEASLAVSHMLNLSRASNPTTITDEVANVLVHAEAEFTPNKRVTGESGKQFKVDFALLSFQSVEGYVKTLSAESPSGRSSSVNSTYRMWSEIHERAGLAVSIVDDRYTEWPAEDIHALAKYSQVFYWGGDQQQFTETIRRFTVGVS